MTMNIGDKAPEILDNTSGCTAEACSLRDHYTELLGAGYEVVGVSKDSAASHVKFKEKYELPFPLIADVNHELFRGEGKMRGKMKINCINFVYVIKYV